MQVHNCYFYTLNKHTDRKKIAAKCYFIKKIYVTTYYMPKIIAAS